MEQAPADRAIFELDAKLHHESELGEFWLASDAMTHTYTDWSRPERLMERLRLLVGAFTVFPPLFHADGKWHRSINQARGVHPKIRDRFDLTLECIRRHDAEEKSPLGAIMARHAAFFGLFSDFAGYIDHFLL